MRPVGFTHRVPERSAALTLCLRSQQLSASLQSVLFPFPVRANDLLRSSLFFGGGGGLRIYELWEFLAA